MAEGKGRGGSYLRCRNGTSGIVKAWFFGVQLLALTYRMYG